MKKVATLLSSKARGRKEFLKHLSPVMLVFIGVLSDNYPCARLSVIFTFLPHYGMATLGTTSIRVNKLSRLNSVRTPAPCVCRGRVCISLRLITLIITTVISHRYSLQRNACAWTEVTDKHPSNTDNDKINFITGKKCMYVNMNLCLYLFLPTYLCT